MTASSELYVAVMVYDRNDCSWLVIDQCNQRVIAVMILAGGEGAGPTSKIRGLYLSTWATLPLQHSRKSVTRTADGQHKFKYSLYITISLSTLQSTTIWSCNVASN